jgi:hypothetical protein
VPEFAPDPSGASSEPAKQARSPFGAVLCLVLLAVVAGVYIRYARSGIDWEFLQTKHYWAADQWYYGGYAGQYFETPQGYRALITEGLTNYTNLFALGETVGPGQALHPVQGFPGTERLATPLLLSVWLRLPGETADVWHAFWQLNVLLWVVSVVLAYRAAALYFDDEASPWFAAILMALYPALTVTFGAIKQQSLGSVYLLLGIVIFEGPLRARGRLAAVAALAAYFFLGQFADGGWCFLAAFLVLRSLWLPGAERWRSLAGIFAALALSLAWFSWLGHAYHLPSAARSRGFSLTVMGKESVLWLLAWISGKDVGGLWFFNYPGTDFFTTLWPLLCRGFLLVHGPLLVLAVAGLVLDRRSRMFTFLIVPMLLVGQMGVVASGWVYHYGYLSFPAGVMALLAASSVLGSLVGRPSLTSRVVAVALATCACWCFVDLKRQAGIYYGGDPSAFTRQVEVHFGDDHGSATY